MTLKKCTRCLSDFECKTDDISSCQCNQIVLSPSTNQFLSKTNYDCLCLNCLKELNALVLKSEDYNIKKPLVENLHFYWENGLMVFTEFFHISKGKCCKNGCRHCAYNYKKKDQ